MISVFSQSNQWQVFIDRGFVMRGKSLSLVGLGGGQINLWYYVVAIEGGSQGFGVRGRVGFERAGGARVECDWMDWRVVLKRRKACINRFQIQMESRCQCPQDLISCLDQDTPLSSLQPESSSHDQHSQAILSLLDQCRPLFLVECVRLPAQNGQLQQEMIKQKILSYNRKEKSLEELSRKFIENFQGGHEVVLELDKVTVQLRVERRRIYDIVNIFESLQVVRKAAKNNYLWRGLREAVKTIHTLSHTTLDSLPYSKKQKSLENLAARFLKLFITCQTPLTLEEAAKVLILTQDSALVKTKIRRLYDIVNVFKSVGLVEKVQSPGKKPGFRWLGTEGLERIIGERKMKCCGSGEEGTGRPQGEGLEKQNSCQLPNRENVNQWFSQEERRAFSALGFMKEFSQKLFFPSIIRKESSLATLGGSQQSLNDICTQY